MPNLLKDDILGVQKQTNCVVATIVVVWHGDEIWPFHLYLNHCKTMNGPLRCSHSTGIIHPGAPVAD